VNVNLELTDHCNIACRMCSQSLRDEAHGAPHRFMDFDTWRRALDGLRGLRDVTLCPHWLGEPTLHPEFDRFVRHAFEHNANNVLFRHFKVHTNAVLLPPERVETLLDVASAHGLLPDTFLAVHFSIDAFARDTYTLVKGADRREVVFRNLERFLSRRAERGLRRPVVHVAYVVQDGNTGEVAAFVEHWRPRLARPVLTADWPPMDRDAVYLRRWNTGDQARADAIHAEACRAVGLAPVSRPEGAF